MSFTARTRRMKKPCRNSLLSRSTRMMASVTLPPWTVASMGSGVQGPTRSKCLENLGFRQFSTRGQRMIESGACAVRRTEEKRGKMKRVGFASISLVGSLWAWVAHAQTGAPAAPPTPPPPAAPGVAPAAPPAAAAPAPAAPAPAPGAAAPVAPAASGSAQGSVELGDDGLEGDLGFEGDGAAPAETN